MAKKKEKKETKPESLIEVHTKLLDQHTKMFEIWKGRDDEINQRIDNIVVAHTKCKSLKGM